MKKRFFLIAGLFLSVLIFFACSKENEPSPTPDSPQIVGDGYKMNQLAKLIDDSWESHVSQSVSDSVIELSSTSGLTLPKVGDILVKTKISDKFPFGFLGRVIAVNKSGGSAEIITENVPLDEAFEELTVTGDSIDMVNNITSITDSVGNPIVFTKGQTSLPQTNEFRASNADDMSLGKTVTFPVKVKYETATLEGSVTMGLKLDFNLNIQQYSVKYFKMAMTPSFSTDLSLKAEASYNGDFNGDVCIATFPLAPITIGPIVVTPKLKVYADVDFTGKISLNVKLSYATSNTFGCDYDGNNWHLINKNNNPNNNSPWSGSFSMSGGVAAGFKDKLQFSLFNMDRMSVAIGFKVSLALTANFEWNTSQAASGSLYSQLQGVNGKLSIPLEGEANVAFHLFKFLSIGKTFTSGYEFVLAQQPLVPPFTNLNTTDGSSPQEKKVSYTSTSSVLFPGGYGIKLYDNLNNLLQTQYYDNTYYLPISTVSFDFKNLTNGKSYIVRPVFNLLGLFEIVGNQSTTFTVKDSGGENSDWVLINGVKWATRNVGAPGTFVANPEDYGGYYQWNSRTNFLLSEEYNNSEYPNSSSWLPANDPSPAGYRVPTLTEIQSLCNLTYVTYEWTTRNDILGIRFIDKASNKSIFLPAAGLKSSADSSVMSNNYGVCWSSNATYAGGIPYYLMFNQGGITGFGYVGPSGGSSGYAPSNGMSVRSVAK